MEEDGREGREEQVGETVSPPRLLAELQKLEWKINYIPSTHLSLIL